jgi:NAD(P)-dependent dehydrogenase (short-subunit alcohol dehydrogenase family)
LSAGAKAAFTQADVGTEAACLAFVNGAAQKFGRLDILVNNAGIRNYEKVDEASAASWNEILSVKLMSYVFCAKEAVPRRPERALDLPSLSLVHRCADNTRQWAG